MFYYDTKRRKDEYVSLVPGKELVSGVWIGVGWTAFFFVVHIVITIQICFEWKFKRFCLGKFMETSVWMDLRMLPKHFHGGLFKFSTILSWNIKNNHLNLPNFTKNNVFCTKFLSYNMGHSPFAIPIKP